MQFVLAADADVTGPPERGIALFMLIGLLRVRSHAGIHILPQCVSCKALSYALQGLK